MPLSTVKSTPIASGSLGGSSDRSSPRRVAPRVRYRVLLVEDNPVDAMRIRQLLARSRTASFEVESQASLAVAQERAVAGDIDLILLDLDLPDSLGLDTYATLAAAVPQVPIVILSRPADEELAIEAVQAGAQDMVLKPSLSAEGLARTIRCAVERHRLVASLRGLSLTDELTGLLNRRGFTTIAQGHLRLAGRTGCRFVLFFVDVDDLKVINDRFGHHQGDQALIRTAAVLRQTFRQSDVVARIGGDEFVILALDGAADQGAAMQRRLAANLAEENAQPERAVALSFSVGTVAFDGRLEEPLGALLARADRALYVEKRTRQRLATAIRGCPTAPPPAEAP
ncbi:MAG: diguanylate cyclase response regulator [Gemmatimonadales bacterium]|nr:diguanylate cyclase response regulator [Gemmatimonadales bacterium]